MLRTQSSTCIQLLTKPQCLDLNRYTLLPKRPNLINSNSLDLVLKTYLHKRWVTEARYTRADHSISELACGEYLVPLKWLLLSNDTLMTIMQDKAKSVSDEYCLFGFFQKELVLT